MSYTICMWRGSSFSNSATGHFSRASGSTVWLVKANTWVHSGAERRKGAGGVVNAGAWLRKDWRAAAQVVMRHECAAGTGGVRRVG